MEYDVVEEIIYGLESGILFGYFSLPLYSISVLVLTCNFFRCLNALCGLKF